MEFERKTIEALLTASNRYKVPDYQRGYAWKVINIEDFWADVDRATDEDPLYLGTLILQKQRGAEAEDYWTIVDGQQRLTTISLLLIACRNIAQRNNWPQGQTIEPTLAFQDITTGGVSALRIEVGKNINSAYEYIVQHQDWDENTFPENIDGRKARIVKNNYKFLKRKIEAFDRSAITDLLKKLLKYTFFLVVEVDEALQAFDIFERTNARGAPLNIADLLKNRLFSNAEMIPDLQDRWDHIVESSEGMLPRIFKYFDTLINGHDTSRRVLFPHLRARADALGPNVFLGEIEVFSKFLNSIVKQNFLRDSSARISNGSSWEFFYNDETFFKRVKRVVDALALFRVYVALPVIYSGLHTLSRFHEAANERQYGSLKSEFLKVLSVIESFHFINNGICTTPTNTAEQLYAVSAKEIFSSETVAECKEVLRGVYNGLHEIGLAEVADFENAFTQVTYSTAEDKPWIAYIFDRMHKDPFERTPTLAIYDPQSDILINRQFEIEHIAPKATWTGDEDVLNNIGNLLVLTMQTNRDVGQLGLQEKIDIYKEQHFDNLQPVEDFVNLVESDDIEIMNEENIANRAKWLARKAYNETWNPWRDI